MSLGVHRRVDPDALDGVIRIHRVAPLASCPNINRPAIRKKQTTNSMRQIRRAHTGSSSEDETSTTAAPMTNTPCR